MGGLKSLGREIDLLMNYPKTNRNIKERGLQKTNEDRALARKFGKDFFDGDRKNGYGGYTYNSRFWSPVVPTFQKYYDLTTASSVLDVGCGKGFMMYDFSQFIPELTIKGIDISEYAVENTVDTMRAHTQVANATKLPFADHTFDLVISINTIHNLERDDLALALQEIERVSRKFKFITVDAYRNAEEEELMMSWNLTAKTIMHVDEWKIFFQKVGYTGDYYWFMP